MRLGGTNLPRFVDFHSSQNDPNQAEDAQHRERSSDAEVEVLDGA